MEYPKLIIVVIIILDIF